MWQKKKKIHIDYANTKFFKNYFIRIMHQCIKYKDYWKIVYMYNVTIKLN